MRLSSALRTVALVEGAKGILVLAAGAGLLSLIHRDVQGFAERLIAHAHLNPAARYPRIFLDLTAHLTDARLALLAAGAAAYASVRFAEAYGLWHARRWAEWLAALSAAIYVPFELLELHARVTWLSVAALALNVAIVALMLFAVARYRGR